MCRRYCSQSLIITRNPESQDVLAKLNVPTELGTDTAWTFEPLSADYGRKALIAAGWDGRRPVLAVCPINPFWWPVKPSLFKAAARKLTGANEQSHYRTIYFHRSGRDVDAAYQKYISAVAAAVRRFRQERGVFVVLIGMEMLDADACRRVADSLEGAPIFASEKYDMYELVSILRACHLIASSRYHAIVTSMPAGVASAGITMDERIRNLMKERGHSHLLLEVDDPFLESRLFDVLVRLEAEREGLRESLHATVARNLRLMARMGQYLEENLARRYPEFPFPQRRRSWEEYLPPLGSSHRQLMEACG
jgi:polysaccharide pyruvyl transferase WcaK-like protein